MKEYLLVCNIIFFARNFLNEHTVTWNFYYFSFSSFLFLIIIIIFFFLVFEITLFSLPFFQILPYTSPWSLVCIHVSLGWVCMHAWKYPLRAEKQGRSPVKQIIASCVPAGMGSGKWIQVSHKSSMYS